MSKKLQTIAELEDKCVDIRSNLLTFIHRIGMGHLGGELSIVEMAVALYYKYLNFDVMDPHKEGRDRFILSKGHCSETLYTIFSDLGAYTQDYMVEHFESLDTYKFGMHSNRKKCPQIEVSAGSLGHGLPIAVGYALGARYRKENYRVMVMIGDGEFDEGTNWEALMAGGHYKLNNLVCILDKNQLQMTGNTKLIMNIDPVADKVRAFGWATTWLRFAPHSTSCPRSTTPRKPVRPSSFPTPSRARAFPSWKATTSGTAAASATKTSRSPWQTLQK